MSVFCYSSGNISLRGEASSKTPQHYLYTRHEVWPVIAASGRGGGRRGQQARPPFREQNSQPKSTDSTWTTSHLNFYCRALTALLLGAKLGCGPWINPSKGLALPRLQLQWGEKKNKVWKTHGPMARALGIPTYLSSGCLCPEKAEAVEGEKGEAPGPQYVPQVAWRPQGPGGVSGCWVLCPPRPCSSVGGGGP